jgi:hypothetical protein
MFSCRRPVIGTVEQPDKKRDKTKIETSDKFHLVFIATFPCKKATTHSRNAQLLFAEICRNENLRGSAFDELAVR